ncbi:hypothetical protein C8D87_105291 [Lentzea atacamensis]|uniref:Uncharacterized protein n=1 Tax=Lentzea atacamensis TaxID=531938 RepID=A0ABX9E8X2_9PSEU|nr:hypothetical protein C8D87_105291 [Lentzea atacamensis]
MTTKVAMEATANGGSMRPSRLRSNNHAPEELSVWQMK